MTAEHLPPSSPDAGTGVLGFLRSESVAQWWRGRTPGRRRALLVTVAALLAAAVIACLVAGANPALPLVAAFLIFVSLRPFPGVVYAATVFCAPLGLWLIGVQKLFGDAFGGRDYVLSLSASIVACALLLVTLVRRPPTGRQLAIGVAASALYGLWVLIGIAHHGIPQTLVGARLTALPVILLVVVTGLTARELHLLISITAWLVIANAVAAIAEYIIGPARLIEFGFEPERAIRYIGTTFRAPGLTEVNAELGLLAGAYLLGYAALWLVRDLRPRRIVWHAGAGAAAVGLALSTSRTGALLLAGGLIATIVLNRGGGPAARKRARLIGAAVVACAIAGFAAVGATGSSSTFERLQVWGHLLRSGAPWYGLGVGSVGAATTSRASNSAQVFVDNYFVSIALQLGIPVLVAVIGLVCWGLFQLSRRSERRPEHAVHLAVVAGLVSGCLMIEAWEYADAMMCLAVFVAYATRASASAPAEPAPASPDPERDEWSPDASGPDDDPAETVRLRLDPAADAAVMHRSAVEDTVLMSPGQVPDLDAREQSEPYRR